MTSPSRQVTNSLLYLFPVIAGNAILLITFPILTRALTKEDYGVYALTQVYAILVSGLANFGLLLGYERNFFEQRNPRDQAALLYSALGFVLLTFAALLALTWVFKPFLARWIVGSPQHATILFWGTCATGVMSLKSYYLTYYKNKENARAYAWYTIDETAMGAVFSVLLVVYVHQGVMGLVTGQLLASLIVFGVLSVKFLRMLRPAFDTRLLADLLGLSFPLTPRILFGVVGNQSDKYLLGLLSSVGGVGIYSIGQKLAAVGFQYMTALQNVYAPAVYRQMFEQSERGGTVIGRYLTGFAYTSVALPFLLAVFSEELVAILTPPPYHGATPVIMVLSLYYALLFFGKVGGAQLTYARKTYLTSALTLLGIVLNVALGVLFIPHWGVMGAAWSTTLSGILLGIVAYYASQRSYVIEWEGLKLAAIFGLLVGSVVALLVVQHAGLPYVDRLALKVVAVLLYVAVGVRLKVITPGWLVEAREVLGRFRLFAPRSR